MSSRAAAGRKRQLRPLQQHEADDNQEPPPPKPSKGFFLKSKASKTQPSRTITPTQVTPYPTQSQTNPNQTHGTPSTQSNTPAHEQEDVRQSVALSARSPIGSALLSKSSAQQQFFTGRPTGTPVFHPDHATFPEQSTALDNNTYLNASYQAPLPTPPTDRPRAQSLALPLPTLSSETICLAPEPKKPGLESHNASSSLRPSTSRDGRDIRHPSPSFSDTSLTSTEFSITAPPPPTNIPQSSLFLQSTSHYSLNLTESPVHRPISRPQTPVRRPLPRPRAETEAQTDPPSSLPSHAHTQSHVESTIERYTTYPSPPSSNPSLTPNPSSLLVKSEPDQAHLPSQRSRSGSLISSPPGSGRTFQPQRRQVAKSTSSTSSDSLPHLPTSPENRATSGFVFPGSRSTARPKVSAKTGTPQKVNLSIKTRAEKHQDEREDTFLPPSPSNTESFNMVSFSSSSAARVESPPQSAPSSTIQFKIAAPALAATDSTSLSETSPPGFVFPSSRSLARPRHALVIKTQPSEDSKNGPKGKTRFMGIRRKKKAAHGPELDIGLTSPPIASPPIYETSGVGSSGESATSSREREEGSVYDPLSPSSLPTPQSANSDGTTGSRRARKGKYEAYPLDPYDSVLLDNDRRTGELLRRLNPTNAPTFHHYGNIPPATVLDLGCGQGHWAFDTAVTWKGYGTRVTGFDMVDTMKTLWPWAVQQGVAENITFVRGNFLKQRLPFPDDSFDLVRMSCLAICITEDSWEPVLREVYRVLTPGGRLELIDDQIFFPYGKAPPLASVATHDPSIPTDMLTSFLDRLPTPPTYTIDTGTINPGLGLALSEEESVTGALYDRSCVNAEAEEETKEESENTDNATIAPHGRDTPTGRATPGPESFPQPMQRVLTANEWNQQYAISKDLEALFEHMLTQKFGIRINPSVFVLELLKKLFGHAREMTKFHLTLAPPHVNQDGSSAPQVAGPTMDGFPESPGLILWPSTLIPMSQAELEIHASKHLRLLLSCKNTLLEHALEAMDDEEIDEDTVLEAIWEYENFLRQRFYPPPDAYFDTQTSLDSELPYLAPTPPHRPSSPMSMLSTTSVTTETQDAMREYQLDFSQHFTWPLNSPENPHPNLAGTPVPPPNPTSIGSPEPSQPQQSDRRNTFRSSVSVAPPYSRTELTHVRTFRVYEAIKVDGLTLGTIN